MIFKDKNKSSGAVSTILLILGVVLIILIVIVFVVVRINAIRNASKEKEEEQTNNEPPPPVYETQLGDVKFIFMSAQDIGNVLKSKDIRLEPDKITTERFIKVVIGAQNKGKINVLKDTWNLGNVVDLEGRNFVPVGDDSHLYYVFSSKDPCGSLLKPEFEPTACIKYYEVSKASTGLKVEVIISPDSATTSSGLKTGILPKGSKVQKALIDLIVQ